MLIGHVINRVSIVNFKRNVRRQIGAEKKKEFQIKILKTNKTYCSTNRLIKLIKNLGSDRFYFKQLKKLKKVLINLLVYLISFCSNVLKI